MRQKKIAPLSKAADSQAEPPPAKPRGRPRSDQATAAVLAAAYKLIAQHGLRGATVDAIAAESGVSKMTIYKWWSSRTLLLIDAFLEHASILLPFPENTDPVQAITLHALRYVVALKSEFGDIQRAVIAECMTENGNATLFFERYLSSRRKLGRDLIERGQRDGLIKATQSAEALYDQIYGTIFYRFLFGLPELDKTFVKTLVVSTLKPDPALRV
jgi:AcrR family transcriptional regulator